MFDLIIFDCDGVLVDSEPIANAVLGRHLERLDLNLTLDEILNRFVGLSMKTVVEKIEAILGGPVPADWLEQVQQDTFAAFEKDLKPVAGIAEILDELHRRNTKFCVASSGSHQKINLSLGLTGLAPYFEGRIFSASQVAHGKPAPDLFLLAAHSIGVASARCIVIEDSAPGVQAAVAAGMTAFGFAARGQGLSLRALGAIVFDDMAQVLQLISMAKSDLHPAQTLN